MKTFNIVFCYSVQETAQDQETAIDNAWQAFAQSNPTNYRDFAMTAEEMEPEA